MCLFPRHEDRKIFQGETFQVRRESKDLIFSRAELNVKFRRSQNRKLFGDNFKDNFRSRRNPFSPLRYRVIGAAKNDYRSLVKLVRVG